MEVLKWVETSQEVKIHISGLEAVNAIFEGDADRSPKEFLILVLNNFGGFLLKIPDSLIGELTQGQRDVVGKFFYEQAERLNRISLEMPVKPEASTIAE